MRDNSKSPKIINIIWNVLWEYGQVCGEAKCQNPHQTIENFGTYSNMWKML